MDNRINENHDTGNNAYRVYLTQVEKWIDELNIKGRMKKFSFSEFVRFSMFHLGNGGLPEIEAVTKEGEKFVLGKRSQPKYSIELIEHANLKNGLGRNSSYGYPIQIPGDLIIFFHVKKTSDLNIVSSPSDKLKELNI